MTANRIIIDAENAPLGRLASYAAKQSLLGNSIIIINCNLAIISGKKQSIINKYKIARAKGGPSLKGPHFPKNPERIVKRTIRGMLSYKQARGSDALKRILCYNDIPLEYQNQNKISLAKEFRIKTISLKELSQII